MMEEFRYVGTLDPTWGRPIAMTSFRGDVLIAMENGQLIRVTENFCSGQLYLQEVHLAQAAPMPNPI